MPSEPSKLEPHREFIDAERRRRTPYRRIAELLAEKGVQVDYSTIHAFVKVRSKPPRKVITMLETHEQEPVSQERISHAAAETPRTEAVSKAQPELSGQLDAIRRLKRSKPAETGSDSGLPGYREGQPLERLSEEEARRIRAKL